jgi:translation initiation factor IF-3
LKKKAQTINDLKVDEIRLIGVDGEQIGIVTIAQAKIAAREAELDLVVISPTAEPPVCRIMDLGKYQFEQRKKAASAKKKQKQIQIKEIKLRPTTDEADYQVKLRSIFRFISEGDKVKITIRFRGREVAHNDLGMEQLQRMIKELGDEVAVEQAPKLEGRQMVMVVAPKKK